MTYSYNDMTDEERMASAQDIYDDTLGSAVADGNLGDYTVQEECGNFAPHEGLFAFDLNWIDMTWIELNGIELHCIALHWTELNWTELN